MSSRPPRPPIPWFGLIYFALVAWVAWRVLGGVTLGLWEVVLLPIIAGGVFVVYGTVLWVIGAIARAGRS